MDGAVKLIGRLIYSWEEGNFGTVHGSHAVAPGDCHRRVAVGVHNTKAPLGDFLVRELGLSCVCVCIYVCMDLYM